MLIVWMYQNKYTNTNFTNFFSRFFKILCLSNLHTRSGALTHSPEIKSHTFPQLRQPGAPPFTF